MTYKISDEASLVDYPNIESKHFYDTRVQQGFWTHKNGNQSFYGFAFCENANACVVISQGRAESAVKYAELVYDFYQNGYSVFVFDHQGQGLSSRYPLNNMLGYVTDFNEYVNDMHALLKNVLDPFLKQHKQEQSDKYLFAHSMGGAIACLYAQKHPSVFKKLALSAPMLGINTPIPAWLAYILGSAHKVFSKLLHKKSTYFVGQGAYCPESFSENKLTNSAQRYKIFRQVLQDYPQNQLGGISADWLLAAISAMSAVKKNAHLLNLDTIVLIAQQEQVVDNKSIHQFAEKLSKAKIVVVDNSKHEIFFEQDPARTFALTQVLDFFLNK